ncbi:MAG: hypothetical protein ACO2O2_08360 [Acidilobaceae archaeon]
MGIEHPILGLIAFTLIAAMVVSSIVLLSIVGMNVHDYILKTPVTGGYARCFTESVSGGVYRYQVQVVAANSGGSDLSIKRLYVSTDHGMVEVPVTSPSFTTTLPVGSTSVSLSVRLADFTGLDLLRGQRGYVHVNLTSTTQLYTKGRVYALHIHFTTIGFDGFTVQEARFKVGEIESCIPVTLPPPPPQFPPSPTPFTWQLREYDPYSGWNPDIRFGITTGNALRMDSSSAGPAPLGMGYAFRYLPRSLLDGNKIVVRLNAFFTFWGRDVGYVYVVDGALLNRRDVSYIFVPDVNSYAVDPWRRAGLRDVRAITVFMPSSGLREFRLESNPLDLTGFQDWVTLVLVLVDHWVQQRVSIDWSWVAVVDPNGRTLVNFTFPYNTYTVVMERSGTLNDYGIVAFNLTQIARDYRPPGFHTTFLNRGDVDTLFGLWSRGSGSCGRRWVSLGFNSYGLAVVEGSAGGPSFECHIYRDLPDLSSLSDGDATFVAFRTLIEVGDAMFGGGFLKRTGNPDWYAGSFWDGGDRGLVRACMNGCMSGRFIEGRSTRVDPNTWYSGVFAIRYSATGSHTALMYVSPSEFVSRSFSNPGLTISSLILGFNSTVAGTIRVYYDVVVATLNREPWVLEFRGIPPGYTVVVRDALGRVIASATSGGDGVARLNIWGLFVILDATVEVYDANRVLRVRVPVPDTIGPLVGGDIYRVNVP